MNGLARICWITAPIYALLGMAFGIWMSASGDHTLSPVHGHMNLLGWVSIALYGTFYTVMPAAAESRLAQIQVLLAQAGVILIVPGIAMAIQGAGEGLAKAGSVIVLLSMLLFVWVVASRIGRTASAV
ncbi:hypothetical protein [Chelativorans salis]|uniref:Uncharacterized protein n=1 Tax=Chelativorans salis TaxID=2978478 RepID=A0ABT2LPY6_9HYPH|nr:hypothetical protein [Chelativorans sp. EGI FJ00035]MCT7376494.1 hypothetical protein [Chelativorans sp. EGI FJ00035]